MNNSDGILKRIRVLKRKLNREAGKVSAPVNKPNEKHAPYNYEDFRSRHIFTTVDGKPGYLAAPNKRTRTKYCEICKSFSGRQLSYHHWDDNDPSQGLWLCHRCHMFAEAVDRGVSVYEYLSLKESIKEEFRQEGLELSGPSLLDIVMSWGLKKEA